MNARIRLPVILSIIFVLSSIIQSNGPVLAASIIPVSTDSVGALELAQTMIADPSTLVSAEFVAAPPLGTPNGTSDALSFFPTHGSRFGILTSGSVLIADDANTSGSSSSDDNGPALPGRGSTAFDVTILKINLNTPAMSNCLRLDFAFYSEEFPEYVGSVFNDAFIAELDQSTWVAGYTIQAPDNFAFDQDGNVISINSTGETRMNDINASGTTYDGATVLLQAATPVTPGAHSLYLSIFDQGDHAWDSAVFVDNIRFESVANPITDCIPGAERKRVPLIFLPGAGGTKLFNHDGEDEVWPSSERLLVDGDDDFLLVLRLAEDGINPFDPNDPDYIITVEHEEILRKELGQDIYDKTIADLEASGYQNGVNFFIFGYDWRKDIEGLSMELLDFIDQVRAQTDSDRVDILAHSQGGIVTRAALARQESIGKVRRVVTMGSPILGAPKILGMLEYQTPCFFPKVPLLGCAVNESTVQMILTNFPSAYQLLPGPAFDIAEDPPVVIDRDTNGDGQLEGPQSYAQWSAIVSANRNAQLMSMNLSFHQAYDDLIIADPQVEFYRVVGDSVNTTPDQIREYNKCFLGRFNCRVAYEVLVANGDGTVPLHSADVYNLDKNFDYRNGIPNAYAHNVNHAELPKNDAVLGFVISYFGGTPTNMTNSSSAMSVPQSEMREPEAIPKDFPGPTMTAESSAMTIAQNNGLSDTPEPFSGIELEVLGSLDVYAEDNLGNLLGIPFQQPGPVIYENIPGGDYFAISDTQVLFFNDVGIYTAYLKVADSNGWRLRVRTYANDQMNGQAVFEVNVPVGGELQMAFTSEQVLADLHLQIDLDGDGVVDQEVSPNSTIAGSAATDQQPPTTAITVNSNANGQCEAMLTAQDQLGGSGVSATYYLLDSISTEPVLYTSPFNFPCGVLVKYMSVDRAGNAEIIKDFQTEPPPTGVTEIHIGETYVMYYDDSGNGDYLIAQHTSLSQEATLQSLSFYVTQAAGRLRLGLYNDNNGNPGTLVAKTDEFTPTVGWNTRSVQTPVLLPPGSYWLAYLPESDDLHAPYGWPGAGQYIGRFYSYPYGELPAAFSSSVSSGEFQFSLYATFTVAVPPGTLYVGEVNVLHAPMDGAGSLLIAQQTSIPHAAVIQSLSFYAAQAVGRLRLGIYNNGYDGPGTLLAQTDEFMPAAGWNTVSVQTPIPLPAGIYWLAFLPESNDLEFKYEWIPGLYSGRVYGYPFGELPASFSLTTTGVEYRFSLYATLIADDSISFPHTAVLDDFNRADGPVGGNWSGSLSNFQIQNNQLAPLYPGSYIGLTWNETFGADQEAYLTIPSLSSAEWIGLSLKANAGGNGIDVLYSEESHVLDVYYGNDGVYTTLAVIPYDLQDGDQLGARVDANGTLTIYVNGMLISTLNASGYQYNAQGGWIGLYVEQYSPNATRIDDFGGGTVSNGGMLMLSGSRQVGDTQTMATPEFIVMGSQFHAQTDLDSALLQDAPPGSGQTASLILPPAGSASLYASLPPRSKALWADGTIRVWFDVTGKRIQIMRYDSRNGWTQIGRDISIRFTDGDRFRALLRPDGALEIYRNGKLLAKRSVTK